MVEDLIKKESISIDDLIDKYDFDISGRIRTWFEKTYDVIQGKEYLYRVYDK